MKQKKEVLEDEVYSHWFAHEAKGPRRSEILQALLAYNRDLDVLENLDDTSPLMVKKRAEALRFWRGPIVQKLPRKTKWSLVEINQEEFRNLTILKDSSWLRFSEKNSYRISVISNVVYKGKKHWLRSEHAETIEHIFDMVKIVDQIDRRLILVCHNKYGPYTLIDGVHRAVAFYIYYFIISEKKLPSFDVFFGLVPQKNVWQP